MSQQHQPDRLPVSAWHVETLRLTAFPTSFTSVSDVGWWQALMGEPPQTRTTRPRAGAQKEQGPFCGAMLVNEVQPNRTDWLLVLAPDQEVGFAEFPTIGPILELLEPFVQLMRRWLELETCPELHRLAFGAVLLMPAENQIAAFRQLSAYLPSIQLDPRASSDFSYQINRARSSTSGISGLRVNRLSKWSIAHLQVIGITSGLPPAIERAGEQRRFACRLELDINTAPDFRDVLHKEQLPAIFEELVQLARELATEGDIP